MMPIEQTIAQLERWIDAIDRDKDRCAQVMANQRSTPIEWHFASARLAYLDVKRVEAVSLLESQKAHRNRWELLLPSFPASRQLKVPLRRRSAERKAKSA